MHFIVIYQIKDYVESFAVLLCLHNAVIKLSLALFWKAIISACLMLLLMIVIITIIGMFISWMAATSDVTKKSKLREKIEQYLKRAEDLKKRVQHDKEGTVQEIAGCQRLILWTWRRHWIALLLKREDFIVLHP